MRRCAAVPHRGLDGVEADEAGRVDGILRSGKMGGHRKRVLGEHCDWTADRVVACPKITSKQLQQDLLAEFDGR